MHLCLVQPGNQSKEGSVTFLELRIFAHVWIWPEAHGYTKPWLSCSSAGPGPLWAGRWLPQSLPAVPSVTLWCFDRSGINPVLKSWVLCNWFCILFIYFIMPLCLFGDIVHQLSPEHPVSVLPACKLNSFSTWLFLWQNKKELIC